MSNHVHFISFDFDHGKIKRLIINNRKQSVVHCKSVGHAFIFLYKQLIIYNLHARMDRQRREEELKNRSSKKGQEAEQAILNRVSLLFMHVFLSACMFFIS